LGLDIKLLWSNLESDTLLSECPEASFRTP
jgi:hypothetical protein